jgi:hypothetical protein
MPPGRSAGQAATASSRIRVGFAGAPVYKAASALQGNPLDRWIQIRLDMIPLTIFRRVTRMLISAVGPVPWTSIPVPRRDSGAISLRGARVGRAKGKA